MNKRQLEVEKAKVAAEKAELKHLKAIYKKASDDISEKIRISNGKINVLLKDFDKLDETQRSILQSQIYQRNFQQSLKKQIDAFTKELESKQYESVSTYLKNCYTTGFTGTLYDLAGQGVPFVFPIDQKKVTKAMVHDTKLSKPLYNRLGEDVNLLKKRIANNISRGIATADSYINIARNIANGTSISINNTMRIARTEGHRIQCAAAYDVQHEARDAGADIVKQWDATLDGHTRETHAMCDGEIVELDETFSNGLEYPGDPVGDAEEVINCRCALLQRARWAVDDEFTKRNNFTGQLETFQNPVSYAEFKQGFFSKENRDYMNYVQRMARRYGTKSFESVLGSMTDSEYNRYSSLLKNNPVFNKIKNTIAKKRDIIKSPKDYSDAFNELKKGIELNKIKYREVQELESKLTDGEIIKRIAGGDKTDGSCSSLALTYIGNKDGLNVLDFRGGKSRSFFAQSNHIKGLTKLTNVKSRIITVQKEADEVEMIIEGLEYGKEYYLAAGKHAAIVRKTEKGAEFLELQSETESGWTSFSKYGSTYDTLVERFKCRKTVDSIKYKGKKYVLGKEEILIEVDSLRDNDEFRELLGYINTASEKQKKGVSGGIK